jgi:phage baseplate assembly protein W
MSNELKLYQGDIYFENGRAKVIDNDEKLAQQTLKILLSLRGGNPFHKQYGSSLYYLIGRYTDEEALNALSSEEIRNTLIYYQRIQKNQELKQTMTDAEVFYRLLNVDVEEISSTHFIITIGMMNREGNNLNIPVVSRR